MEGRITMDNSQLAVRMKEFYEQIPKTKLMRRTPVAIRLDGKAFHTFTRGFKKPFDHVLIAAMQKTMKALCENIQGCVFGYTQSDEITLILADYKKLNSSAWFDYEVQKMCSIAASMATMYFNKFFEKEVLEYIDTTMVLQDSDIEKKYLETLNQAMEKGAMFDARVFNIPKEEVANLLYWRQLDATRNSIQMVGQKYFTHKELQGVSCNQIQNKLLTEKDVNWNDFKPHLKRGTCCYKQLTFVVDEREPLEKQVPKLRSYWYVDIEPPIFKEDWHYIDKHIFIDEKIEAALRQCEEAIDTNQFIEEHKKFLEEVYCTGN